MRRTRQIWTDEEEEQLLEQWKKRPPYIVRREFEKKTAQITGRSIDSIKAKISQFIMTGKVEKEYIGESPYPVYDSPLVMTGDAVILPDLEFPFHHAEFVNRVLDLADTWKIKQCILAGDILHFDSISGWEPNFTKERTGGLTEKAENELMEWAQNLPAKYREAGIQKIAEIGRREEQDGMSTELEIARTELRRMSKLFDKIDFLLGNHEGRLLRALQTALNPQELLRLLEAGDKWRIACYYYSHLDTPAGCYQIEHPKGAAEGTAQGLAAKYHAHVIMGHSHLLDFSWDISGQYYAIHAGHCVDERRLPYAAQRHTTKRMHKHGAVIVRDGYPWLLHDGTDWGRMKSIK